MCLKAIDRSYMYNRQTRTRYDKDQLKLRERTDQQPLKWYTNNTQQNRYLEYGNMLNHYHVGTRAKPTRLNENERDNTELYGTAPYMALHDGNVHIETGLFQGRSDGLCKSMNKISEYDQTNYYIRDKIPSMYAGLPLLVETDRIGHSTRNELIEYGN